MPFHEYVMDLFQDFIDSLSPFAAQAWREEPAKWWTTPVSLANALIDAYSTFEDFRSDWKWMRLLVPLQGRLLTEQLLWDRGLPWRSLITGFRAIEGDAGQTGVSGPALPPTPLENQTPSQPHAPCPSGYYWDGVVGTCLPIAAHREAE